MATVLTPLAELNDTDAHFRAWVQFIENVLVITGGWVVTSDTGQMNISTALHPTVAYTSVGYRVYAMSDALQATAPVFMRLDYGNGPGSLIPGFGFWIGTGSDGAGNITGPGSRYAVISSTPVTSNGSGAGPYNCYGSAAPNRCTLGMWTGNAPSAGVLVFAIERTKSATGADSGDGLLLVWTGYQAAWLNRTAHILFGAVGQQAAVEAGLSYVLTTQNPSQSFGGDIGVGVISHFRGVSVQPGMNVLIVNSNDVANEGSFSIVIYGATRTYQHLNVLTPMKTLAGGAIVVDANARCCIRYD